MLRYITHFQSMQWNTLHQTAGLGESNLLDIPKYVKEGKNGLCYAYVLGKCQGWVCGKYPDGHMPASDISDEFATVLQQVLTAGIELQLTREPPTMQQQFTYNSAGASPKRYKRTA
jgi:hypothetical protein